MEANASILRIRVSMGRYTLFYIEVRPHETLGDYARWFDGLKRMGLVATGYALPRSHARLAEVA